MAELADYAWLTGAETTNLLAELAADPAPLHRQLDRLRKVLSVERARLAVEQVDLRRRAATKFGLRAERMFFTDLGLQQATDCWIGRYKAGRFPQQRGVFDLASGIGGDLVSQAERGPVIGCERVPEIALLAEANLRACGYEGEVCVRDVAESMPAAGVRWHLDPDRRAEGRRSTHVEWHSPSLEVIEQLLSSAPHGSIKLSPATEVPPDWEKTAELEWISRDRECRQLVAWFGDLARLPGQHRATLVKTPFNKDATPSAYSFAGQPNVTPPVASEIGAYIYDTDPAIRAATLTGALCQELGLFAIASGPSYLTACRCVEHPLVTPFRVIDVLPLREKELAKYLRERQVGRLEIKKRGVETGPELLRARLKLKGGESATLLLARHGAREIAILAERCGGPEADLG